LTNGNYVVVSDSWNEGGVGDVGAATWVNGATGQTADHSGFVDYQNSLIGSDNGDTVGDNGAVALTNGNYVVISDNWDNYRGAVTWLDGSSGQTGGDHLHIIDSENSLVGSNPGNGTGDVVGGWWESGLARAVTPLTNGDYVVCSPAWNQNRGAVTWGDGLNGISGPITSANSLIGGIAGTLQAGNYVGGDQLGIGGSNGIVGLGSVTALTNGNYVIAAPQANYGTGLVFWSLGTSQHVSGIADWWNATLAGSGALEPDQVGSGGVTALANGNFVVASPKWNNGEGAVTWFNGSTGTGIGTAHVPFSGNSLLGYTPASGGNPGDQVGSGGVTALANGNYVVTSPLWFGDRGAVTWGNGTSGGAGSLSSLNSLVGSVGDQVGSGGVTALTNGNYVVASPLWSGHAGALTWGSGTTGVSGLVITNFAPPVFPNSLTINGAYGLVDSFVVTALPNGNYLVDTRYQNSHQETVTLQSGAAGVNFDNLIGPSNSLIGPSASSWALTPPQPLAGGSSFAAAFPFSTDGGQVLIVFTDPNQLTFAMAQSQTVTVTPSLLEHGLLAGTNITLQASNDITFNSGIFLGPGDPLGTLTLRAGRSILLNATMSMDSGNLTLIANDTQADGVVNGQRDPGNAVIAMAPSVSFFNIGTATLSVDLKTSTDKTNNGHGVGTLLGFAAGATMLSRTSTLGITINGTTPGDGIAAGTYTQVNDTGPLNLNGAPLQLIHSAATTANSTFTIVHSTAGVQGTFAGLPEGAAIVAADGTVFTISYQTNGGHDVVLTQLGPASQLILTTAPPATVMAGTGFGLAVTAEDSFGHAVPTFTGTVTVSVGAGPSGALGGTKTVQAVNGVATFSGLTLSTAGSYSLAVSANGLSSASASLSVTPIPVPGQLQFSTAAYSVGAGTGSASITVTRSGGSDGTVTVNYATSDGTAHAGTDYTAASGTLSLGPGNTSQTFQVTPLGNGQIPAGGLTLHLTLSQPGGGGSLGNPSTAVLTLLGSPTVTLSGTVFQDINGNGVPDAGEPGLAGQTVFLDLSGSGVLTSADPTATTDGSGRYQFTVASHNPYTVRTVLLGGMLLAAPAAGSYAVTTANGNDIPGLNFAEVPTSIAVPLTLPLSSPFPKQGSANADFVEALYRAILDRNAEPAGLAYWAGQLSSGALSRLQVVQGIRQSNEHFTQEVTDFHATLLGRAPDAPGLQSWVQQLASGQMTEEQVASAFLDSPEYLSKGDRYFVDHMYLSLLGRPFDAAGEAQWLNALGDNASGNATHPPSMTYPQVIGGFLRSPESLLRLVQGYYQVFLQRLADPTGLSYWLTQLQQGGSFLSIGQGFLASDEFYNDAAAHG
jgi:hypothetical protein